MDDTRRPPDVFNLQPKTVPPSASATERLVHDAWRHYYVARLAEAQFGPDSLEASIAHSRAMTSYRELRGTLRDMDPYYRRPALSQAAPKREIRHLRLVRDEPDHQPDSQS